MLFSFTVYRIFFFVLYNFSCAGKMLLEKGSIKFLCFVLDCYMVYFMYFTMSTILFCFKMGGKRGGRPLRTICRREEDKTMS